MILGQVREDERVEADAIEPVQHRGVRGGLERDAAIPGVEHLAEGALQVDRLGRRPHDRPRLPSDPALDGAEQARAAAGGRQDRVQQVCRRRLAVRAGDAGDLELARRLPEEDVRGGGHRGARRQHDELRNLWLDRPLDDENGGAALDRLGGEVVSVRVLAGNAEERRAGGDGTRVVGEVPHLDGVGAAEDRLRCERGNEALELHVRGTLPSGGARSVCRIGRDLELDEAVARDLGEGGRRDDAAPDRSVRLVDRDQHDESRILRRHDADERGDVARARVAATLGLLRPCRSCPRRCSPARPRQRRCRPRPRRRRGASPSSAPTRSWR